MNLHSALASFDSNPVRAEAVVRAEALPFDDLLKLWRDLRGTSDSSERFELAAQLDGAVGSSPWGLLTSSVADAYVLAGDEDLAFERRLEGLARTPKWDRVLAAHQLVRTAAHLRTRGLEADARACVARAEDLDPTLRPGEIDVGAIAACDDADLLDLLVLEEYSSCLASHLASPRRFALACLGRGAAACAAVPLATAKRWERYVGAVGEVLQLGAEEAFEASTDNNARLLVAARAKIAIDAAERKPKNLPAAFNVAKGNARTYAELAARGDWNVVRLGLLSWDRGDRLATAGLLVLLLNDPLATAFVERSAALGAELGRDGSGVNDQSALPRKILARRAGEPVTWWGAP